MRGTRKAGLGLVHRMAVVTAVVATSVGVVVWGAGPASAISPTIDLSVSGSTLSWAPSSASMTEVVLCDADVASPTECTNVATWGPTVNTRFAFAATGETSVSLTPGMVVSGYSGGGYMGETVLPPGTYAVMIARFDHTFSNLVTVGVGVSIEGPADDVTQEVGLPASGRCDAVDDTTLNWGGAESGGWTKSWSEWAVPVTGGWVCARTLHFSNALQHWIVLA